MKAQQLVNGFLVIGFAVLGASSASAAWWIGGEEGSWQEPTNWNSTDYMGGGQIWFTVDHLVHVTTEKDLGVPKYTMLFHNTPDLEVDLKGHSLHLGFLALGCANDGNHLTAVPKAEFRNGEIAATNAAGEVEMVTVQLPAHTYAALDHGEYVFDSIRFPNVKFQLNESALTNQVVRFTNCVINVTQMNLVSRWTRCSVSYEDCLVSNRLIRANLMNQMETGNTLAFDRSVFYGAELGNNNTYVGKTHIHDSTMTFTGNGYVALNEADVRRSTLASAWGFCFGYCGGSSVLIDDSTLTVKNGQFPLEILCQHSTSGAPVMTNKTVSLRNTTMNVVFDETVKDQYWGAMIGYNSGMAPDSTLVTENFKFAITDAVPVQARFYMGNMSNFTWRIVGGGTVLKHAFTGDFAYDANATRCQIGGGMTGDSKVVFEVPKKGMTEPALTLEFPKTVGWDSAFAKVEVDAQKWVDRTGGEVCLLKSNGQLVWTSIENLFKNAVLPRPAKEGDEVKIEIRNGGLEAWLVAPEVHNGLAVIVR